MMAIKGASCRRLFGGGVVFKWAMDSLCTVMVVDSGPPGLESLRVIRILYYKFY